MRYLAPLAVLGILAIDAVLAFAAFPPYHGDGAPKTDGTGITQYQSGNLCLAASTATAGTCTINADGINKRTVWTDGVNYTTMSATGISAAVFHGTADAAATASVVTSTGIQNGTINTGVKITTGSASPLNTAGGFVGLDSGGKLPALDGSQLTNLPGANATPQPAFLGVNYLLWSSSGAVVADSTATFSFNVEASSMVFRGNEYTTSKQNFVVIASTFSMITWNPTNGFRQFGLKDLNPATISSETINNINDDISVVLSSSDANGNVYLFPIYWANPGMGALRAQEGAVAPNNNTAGAVSSPFNCPTGQNFYTSCSIGTLASVLWGASDEVYYNRFSSVGNDMLSFVVNNLGSGSQNITAMSTGNDTHLWVSIDGKTPTAMTASATTQYALSVGTGYHLVLILMGNGSSSNDYSLSLKFPANMRFVRGGF